MSKTDDLDATIRQLNDMLTAATVTKDKLAIVDRILKAQNLRAKLVDDGKGSKFGALPSSPASTERPSNGGRSS